MSFGLVEPPPKPAKPPRQPRLRLVYKETEPDRPLVEELADELKVIDDLEEVVIQDELLGEFVLVRSMTGSGRRELTFAAVQFIAKLKEVFPMASVIKIRMKG